MIHNLVQSLTTLLQSSLPVSFNAPEKQIQVGLKAAPTSDSLPFIRIYIGKLAISQKASELNVGQPRPQEYRQRIEVTDDSSTHYYPLSHIPLEGSVRVRLVTNPDQLTERTVSLIEPQDFVVDYMQGVVSFKQSLPLGSLVLVQFSFAGIFTLREFTQDLLIEIFGANELDLEQWTTLVTAIVLTSQTELIEQYNANNTSGYREGLFAANSTIAQIALLEIVPDYAANPLYTQLHFQVQGQLKLTKESSDKAFLIKKVHSLGQVSDFPIDINLEIFGGRNPTKKEN
jgi:hypothetical protein